VAAAVSSAGIFFTLKPRTPDLPPHPPGLIAWWKGDGDGSDSSGHLTIEQLDGVGFGEGKVGLGFEFDGKPHCLTLSNAAALNFGAHQDFSIEAWIRPLPAETSYGIM